MKILILAHRNPSILGMHVIQVRNGIWDRIEALDNNDAARKFLVSHRNQLSEMRDWRLYVVSKTLVITLLDYAIDEVECNDPKYAC